MLNLVSDASAQTYIHSFEIFFSRRGCLQAVFSDSGRPFITYSTKESIANCYIQWKFSVAEVPWQGGF